MAQPGTAPDSFIEGEPGKVLASWFPQGYPGSNPGLGVSLSI